MNDWLKKIANLFAWKGALPYQIGMDRVSIHFSAIVALAFAAVALAVLSMRSGVYTEFRSTVLTLPIVWTISLAVRSAAQWLSIGSHSDEFEMVIGPAGNISNDYERLSGPAMLSYAVAGQSATLLLGLLGLLVVGAIAPTPAAGITIASLLDFRPGVDSGAWASQIVWVNLFLFTSHLLPATPFDARALVVGWCRVTQPSMSAGRIHRMLASTDSHLAFALAGVSLAMIVANMNSFDNIPIWYALLFVSIFLLTVSQYETYQAYREDVLAEPLQPLLRRRDPASSIMQPQSTLSNGYTGLSGYAQPTTASNPADDVDEILRKLHREGQDSLSSVEREALMNASRALKARRSSND